MNDQESKGYDDGFYRLKTDKAGNGSAVIRFLPPFPGEQPEVCYYSHYFKEGDKVYNELSLTTIGKKDPVGETNSKLWNSGYDADKKIASARKRRSNYVSNILVIRDPANPENEGKIFMFRYGTKIKDKINSAWKTNPGFEDDAIQPYNLGPLGADFILDQKKKDGYPNYDDSKFRSKAAVFGGDMEKLKAIINGQNMPKLSALLDPSRFKSYDDIKKRFDEVTGESSTTSRAGDADLDSQNDRMANSAVSRAAEQKPSAAPVAQDTSVTDDDDLAFFQRVANGN